MIIKKDMGISHKDFFRLLPRAMGTTGYEITGNQVKCQLPSGTLTISLGEEQERRLSPLVIFPRTEVVFEYDGVTDEDRLVFTKYFELRFMRGLG